MAVTKLVGDFLVTVDDEDAELLHSVKWRVSSNKGKHYVRVGQKVAGARKTIYLHRKILEDSCAGLVVDHINGDTLDNRRCNLRVSTVLENCQNIRKPKRTSKSGLLGANWHKSSQSWRAQLRLKGATIHIGYFRTAEEAHAAYLAKKRELHRTCSI